MVTWLQKKFDLSDAKGTAHWTFANHLIKERSSLLGRSASSMVPISQTRKKKRGGEREVKKPVPLEAGEKDAHSLGA